jgi:tRNA pseudouridine55 synthase
LGIDWELGVVKLGIDTPPATTLHGGVLVDKPSGPTSHDIVGFIRRLLNTKRVGHTGTLDPLATGLLVLLVGHATRLSQFLVSDTKEYIADIRLGVATPTYDAASLDEARDARREVRVTPEQVRAVLAEFTGTFRQVPPSYSAKKVDGVRAYERARRDESVVLNPVEVTVHELERLESRASHVAPDPTLLRLRIVCSSGFYVRSLAHDLGQALGCGAHLEALRRTRVGRFRIDDAASLDVLERMGPEAITRLVPMNDLLGHYPAIGLTAEGLPRAFNGNPLGPRHLTEVAGSSPTGSDALLRVLAPDGALLSVAERRPDGLLHPLLVLR